MSGAKWKYYRGFEMLYRLRGDRIECALPQPDDVWEKSAHDMDTFLKVVAKRVFRRLGDKTVAKMMLLGEWPRG